MSKRWSYKKGRWEMFEREKNALRKIKLIYKKMLIVSAFFKF